MEARLAEAAETNPAPAPFVMPASSGDDESEAVAVNSPLAASSTDEEKYSAAPLPGMADDAPWPVDESSESAYHADVRERGETVAVPPPKSDLDDESDSKATLPSVEELMMRIPANVRETMDNLFRAKFVKVRKVPKRVLKGNT